MVIVNKSHLARYDYGESIPFKLYEEDDSVYNATGRTVVIKSYKRHGDRAFFHRDVAKALTVQGQIAQLINDISVSWTDQANGEGTFSYTATDRPTVAGHLWISAQATSSGYQESSDLVRIYIQPSEAA